MTRPLALVITPAAFDALFDRPRVITISIDGIQFEVTRAVLCAARQVAYGEDVR